MKKAFAYSICCILAVGFVANSAEPINVVIWDEQQPSQKEAYDDFLGNEIANFLKTQPGLNVRSTSLGAAEKGLADNVLDSAQVLVWWGHVRQFEISPEKGKEIVQRIKRGQLSLLALHSAHWATPFVEAMNERTQINARSQFPTVANGKLTIKNVAPPKRYTTPDYDTRITPRIFPRKFPDGRTELTIHLPICCFPAYRNDGKPSSLFTLLPDHPIAKGVPAIFQLPSTEMYDEPFHVPEPDEVVFEERWPTGEWFRSGALWNIGKGKVFYFRPGHETFPVYKQKVALQIVENAVRYLADELPD
ncbi:MAG: ThuA domain-containing protein [Pirellulaceae bacterium]